MSDNNPTTVIVSVSVQDILKNIYSTHELAVIGKLFMALQMTLETISDEAIEREMTDDRYRGTFIAELLKKERNRRKKKLPTLMESLTLIEIERNKEKTNDQ